MAVDAKVTQTAFGADALAAQVRCERTYHAFARSIGPAGAHALLNRALSKAMERHPALKCVRIEGMSELGIRGVSEMTQLHGDHTATVALQAVLDSFLASLSNLIGADLVARLLEQAGSEPMPDQQAAP